MAQEAGESNFFLFGLTAEQVAASRGWYNPYWHYEHEPETRRALDMIAAERLQPARARDLRPDLGHAPAARRPLHAPRRPGRIREDAGRSRGALPSAESLDAPGRAERRPFGQVLERPDDRRVRKRDLGGQSRVTSIERSIVMANHPLAGQPAPESVLIDVPALERAYHANRPDPADPRQRVDLRHQRPSRHVARSHVHRVAHPGHHAGDLRLPAKNGIDGPLFMGKDTHALSEPGAADGPRSALGRAASRRSCSATTE